MSFATAATRQLARHVQRGAPDECWPWTGWVNHDGYGRPAIAGRKHSAHRLAWEIANGRSAGDLSVLHSCDNPPCCNPAHLRLGTATDNQRDCVERGRRPNRKGSRHPLAKLTEATVVAIRARCRAGERQCDLAEEFGVSKAAVSGIVRHPERHWSHV